MDPATIHGIDRDRRRLDERCLHLREALRHGHHIRTLQQRALAHSAPRVGQADDPKLLAEMEQPPARVVVVCRCQQRLDRDEIANLHVTYGRAGPLDAGGELMTEDLWQGRARERVRLLWRDNRTADELV